MLVLNTLSRILLLLLLLFPLCYKIYFTQIAIDRLLGEGDSVLMPILTHDAMVYLAILLLLAVSNLARLPNAIRFFIRLFTALIFLVYTIDILTFRTFFSRLDIDDIVKYMQYAPQYIVFVVKQTLAPAVIALIGLLMAVLLLYVASRAKAFGQAWYLPLCVSTGQRRILSVVVVLLACLHVAKADSAYVHGWYYQNFFEYALVTAYQAKPYSDDFVQALSIESAAEKYRQLDCKSQAQPRRPNIIIVIVESLSMYHSQQLMGKNNFAPHFDRIAATSVRYDNFYANGFTTEDGLIAILTGLAPLYSPDDYSLNGGVAFKGFYDLPDSLPAALKKAAYTTAFLTSGDLKFSNKGKWLAGLGFDTIEGNRHPYYRPLKRYNFASAADEALYHRASSTLGELKSATEPYFMVVETVSTHHPYINPDNDEKSESGAFLYADRMLGKFYDELLAEGFFDDGMLVISSDHRAMTPLSKAEVDLFGYDRAPALIPLLIAGPHGQQGRVSEAFQQIDIMPSLVNMVSGQRCYSRWQGDLWNQPRQTAEFIIHRRGDRRDIVSVFADGSEYRVRLNGDATKFMAPVDLDKRDSELLLNKINYERIQ